MPFQRRMQTRNDRSTVWHSTTHSGPRRAIQSGNQVHNISSGPLGTTFFVFYFFFTFVATSESKKEHCALWH